MNARRAPAVYRGLLRLYPRRFRQEYGADMEVLFRDQLRDDPAGRVWARTVVDLATTIPARHLEAHVMRRTRTPRAARPVAAHWWKFLLVGIVYFAAISTAPGSVDDPLYTIMTITFPFGVLITCVGLGLGVTHLSRYRRAQRAAL